MAMANYDGRTPLHVAASEGGLEFWKNILNEFIPNCLEAN